MKRKIIFWICTFILGTTLLGYPPQKGNSQPTTSDSTLYQKITAVQSQNKALKDSIRSTVANIQDNLPAPKSKTKVVYKTKIKKVPVIVKVHDTINIYTPVNKSQYFINSKNWSDSLAREQHITDSIAAQRTYELKHRSIFSKIFGSKPNK